MRRAINKSFVLTYDQRDVVECTALHFLDRRHYLMCWSEAWQARVTKAALRSLTDMPFWYAIHSSLIEEPLEALLGKIEALDNVSFELPGIEKPSLTAAKLLGGDKASKDDKKQKSMGIWSFFQQDHVLSAGDLAPVDRNWLFPHYPWAGSPGTPPPSESKMATLLVETRATKVMVDAFILAWETYRKR